MTLLAPLTNSLDPKFFTAYVISRFTLENAEKSFSEKYQVRPVLRSALDLYVQMEEINVTQMTTIPANGSKHYGIWRKC